MQTRILLDPNAAHVTGWLPAARAAVRRGGREGIPKLSMSDCNRLLDGHAVFTDRDTAELVRRWAQRVKPGCKGVFSFVVVPDEAPPSQQWRLTLTLTQAERDAIEAQAAAKGKPVSRYLIELAVGET